MYPFIPWNFLGLDSSITSYKKAKFVIVPIPYDSTQSYRTGSRNGPHQIIDASRYVERFDMELQNEPYKKGIFTFDEMETVKGNPAKTLERVRLSVKNLLNDSKIPILIGGEHTITFGAVQAFPRDIIVVVFDAHADLRESYEGDHLSHACVMRRIIESGRDIIVIGVRSMSQEEYNFAKENAISIFFREAMKNKFRRSLTDILSKIKGKNVYLSLDVDVFDPSEVPAVSTPEPDGLSFGEVKETIREICYSANIVGVDLVEVTPIPGNNITEFLSARILYKIIGYVR
ncbi:agmatinase [Candidatus Bathyarchaeota archaeon]|nr:agmatinase [Candidatus Bathyarchaeota archaeon]